MHLPLGSAQLQLLLLICLGHVDIKQTNKQADKQIHSNTETHINTNREAGKRAHENGKLEKNKPNKICIN